MIPYDQALSIIKEQGQAYTIGTEDINIQSAIGRTLSKDVISPMNNQPFDNSAMDGFAVLQDDILGASTEHPVELKVVGQIAAGQGQRISAPQKGQCYEIMTGAPMPEGCNVVVPVEMTDRKSDRVAFKKELKLNDNIRFSGQDIKAGSCLIKKSTLFCSRHVLTLATIGLSDIEVFKKIKVAIISTGAEVINNLAHPLKPGEIYNSTGPYLENCFQSLSCEIVGMASVGDDPSDFIAELENILALTPDLIITTGAVSAGAYDFIKKSLLDIGAEILFHKVKIRPGKPLLFARLKEGPLLFGLPGNPVASAAAVRFFILPLLNKMQLRDDNKPFTAKVLNHYSKTKEEFRFFLRAELKDQGNGQLGVNILNKQQSFMVEPFVHASHWAVMKEGIKEINQGDVVEVCPIDGMT
jgi:molybdopterin molybdotransferase